MNSGNHPNIYSVKDGSRTTNIYSVKDGSRTTNIYSVKDGSRTKGGVKQLCIRGMQTEGEGGGGLPRKRKDRGGEVQ